MEVDEDLAKEKISHTFRDRRKHAAHSASATAKQQQQRSNPIHDNDSKIPASIDTSLIQSSSSGGGVGVQVSTAPVAVASSTSPVAGGMAPPLAPLVVAVDCSVQGGDFGNSNSELAQPPNPEEGKDPGGTGEKGDSPSSGVSSLFSQEDLDMVLGKPSEYNWDER